MKQLSLLRCLRWRKGRSSYAPEGQSINPDLYIVEPIGHHEAKSFVCGHHYSGTYPAVRVRMGMFKQGEGLVGVAVFGVPMSQAVIPKWCGEQPHHGVELSRFVLLDHIPKNGET